MFGRLGVPELLIILLIVLDIFGATRLPQLGKAIAQGLKNSKHSGRPDAPGANPPPPPAKRSPRPTRARAPVQSRAAKRRATPRAKAGDPSLRSG